VNITYTHEWLGHCKEILSRLNSIYVKKEGKGHFCPFLMRIKLPTNELTFGNHGNHRKHLDGEMVLVVKKSERDTLKSL